MRGPFGKLSWIKTQFGQLLVFEAVTRLLRTLFVMADYMFVVCVCVCMYHMFVCVCVCVCVFVWQCNWLKTVCGDNFESYVRILLFSIFSKAYPHTS